jgi:hypothetical protein
MSTAQAKAKATRTQLNEANVEAPPLLELIHGNIPASLQRLDRWAPWVGVWKPEAKGGKGKYDKVPRSARNPLHNLSSKARWFDFSTALGAWEHLSIGYEGGVGFKVTGLRGAVFGDLDDCFDSDGELKPWAAEIVQRANTYTERSPSGHGIRFILRGDIAADWTQVKPEKVAEGVTGIEMYGGNAPRFLTLTGHKLEGSPDDIAEAPEGFLEWLETEYRKVGSSALGDRLPPPDMPDLVDEGDLPRLEDLPLPGYASAFLLEGKSGVDGSRTLAATAIGLLEATAAPDGSLQPDVVLSLMADNPHVAEIVERHRGDDRDKGLEYLWKHQVMKGMAKAKPVVAEFEDLSDETEGVAKAEGRKEKKPHHPMLEFVPFDGGIQPPRYVVPGFIGTGVVVIAGQHGIGKTTAILPLAGIVAHVDAQTDDPLRPKEWRHVVYITEDIEQAKRVLAATTNGDSEATARVQERIHLVAARRMPSGLLVTVGKDYAKMFTRTVGDVELPPLVVIDTRSAVFAVEDENDNAQASEMVNHLKQDFAGLPTWIVGHVAKAVSKTEASSISMRGASAIEGDVHQVLFLVQENNTRFLVRGKTRFEARWKEMAVHTVTTEQYAADEWGDTVSVTLRRATFEPLATGERQKRVEQQKLGQVDAELQRRREEAVQLVREAREKGEPVNKTSLQRLMGGKKSSCLDLIDALLDEGHLYEQPIPSAHRLHPKRDSLLVELDEAERAALLEQRQAPLAKILPLAPWAAPGGAEMPPVREAAHAS